MTDRYEQQVAMLQRDLDAAVKSSEANKILLNKEKLQVLFNS